MKNSPGTFREYVGNIGRASALVVAGIASVTGTSCHRAVDPNQPEVSQGPVVPETVKQQIETLLQQSETALEYLRSQRQLGKDAMPDHIDIEQVDMQATALKELIAAINALPADDQLTPEWREKKVQLMQYVVAAGNSCVEIAGYLSNYVGSVKKSEEQTYRDAASRLFAFHRELHTVTQAWPDTATDHKIIQELMKPQPEPELKIVIDEQGSTKVFRYDSPEDE